MWNNAEANLGLGDIQNRSLVSFSRDSGCLNANNLPPSQQPDLLQSPRQVRRHDTPNSSYKCLFNEDLMTICTNYCYVEWIVCSPDVISYQALVTKSVGVDIMVAIGLQNILAVRTW